MPSVDILHQSCRQVVDNNQLLVDWSLLEVCNQYCSYCFTTKEERPKFIPALDQLRCGVDNLAALKKSKYHLYLIGGEITMLPYFPAFIEYANATLGDALSVMMVTNGYRPWQYFEDLIAVSKNTLRVEVSVHPEYAKLDNLIGMAEHLTGKAVFNFKLMYYRAKKDYIKEIHAALMDMKQTRLFDLGVSPLLAAPDYVALDPSYSPDDLRWMQNANKLANLLDKERGVNPQRVWDFVYDYATQAGNEMAAMRIEPNNLLQKGLLRFKEMYCCQGIGYFHITHAGDCLGTRCGLNTGPVANIFTPGAQPFGEGRFPYALQCPFENCVCAPHHILPKYKRIEDAVVFTAAHGNKN